MTQPLVTLRRQDLTLDLCPSIGGAVTAFRLDTASGPVDLLRATPGAALADRNVLLTSCYPLVPFSNRIRDGRFTFRQQPYRLEPNLPGHPHPLHGHGWLGSWQLRDQSPASASLTFEYRGADFPSAYACAQHFELSPSSLRVKLDLSNTGEQAMPCGIGLHPFFPKPPRTALRANLRQVWLGTDDCIPVTRVDVPERWDFAAGRALDTLVLDHCFGGWDRRATVEWPTRGLALEITATGPAEHAVIYAPANGDFFCFEPVTNANDAFNLSERQVPDVGVQVLGPGESLSLDVLFTVAVR